MKPRNVCWTWQNRAGMFPGPQVHPVGSAEGSGGGPAHPLVTLGWAPGGWGKQSWPPPPGLALALGVSCFSYTWFEYLNPCSSKGNLTFAFPKINLDGKTLQYRQLFCLLTSKCLFDIFLSNFPSVTECTIVIHQLRALDLQRDAYTWQNE